MSRSGRSIGLRYTILYTGLFLVSAIGLLLIINLVAQQKVTQVAPGQSPQVFNPAERISELQRQLATAEMTQNRQLLVGSLIALAVMAVASVLLGRLTAARVLRPLRTITAATRRISADNLHERLAVAGPKDEVKDLADTIDGLLERLETSFAAQRRFAANASHELRTPLATMRASLDVAMAKAAAVSGEDAGRQEAGEQTSQAVAEVRAGSEGLGDVWGRLAGRLRGELDRMDHLLEGFLVLARAQSGGLAGREGVSLGKVARESLAARGEALADKRVTVQETGLSGRDWADGVPGLIERLVGNVIDNAVIHNERGGWIRLASGNDAESAWLTVETGGRVLDQRQVDRLGQPFQRLGADRIGSDQGSGLGLSIVAAIAEAHGGGLELAAREEGGLRVTIALPRSMTPQGVPG